MAENARAVATLGGGCFWCLESVFQEVRGVESVLSGYAGGDVPDPTYEQVCGGRTGHAEVVRITFDPEMISYREILDIFFAIHDPTTPDRQGADVGTQYRSVIFHHSPEQKRVAEQAVEDLESSGALDAPVVTQIQPVPDFYPAEEYHQEYYRRNPAQAYCRMVISPKLAAFRKRFGERLKS